MGPTASNLVLFTRFLLLARKENGQLSRVSHQKIKMVSCQIRKNLIKLLISVLLFALQGSTLMSSPGRSWMPLQKNLLRRNHLPIHALIINILFHYVIYSIILLVLCLIIINPSFGVKYLCVSFSNLRSNIEPIH